jgi:hypothetical protein
VDTRVRQKRFSSSEGQFLVLEAEDSGLGRVVISSCIRISAMC